MTTMSFSVNILFHVITMTLVSMCIAYDYNDYLVSIYYFV